MCLNQAPPHVPSSDLISLFSRLYRFYSTECVCPQVHTFHMKVNVNLKVFTVKELKTRRKVPNCILAYLLKY